MRHVRELGLFFAVAAFSIAPGSAAMEQTERLRFDMPTTLNGVELVCTGIGREVRENPAWAAYPLKVEVAGASGQFLGNVEIAIEQDGEHVVSLVCGGPWILARLEPGDYTVNAGFEGAVRSGNAAVPANGQTRLVMIFPDGASSGAVSTERSASP